MSRRSYVIPLLSLGLPLVGCSRSGPEPSPAIPTLAELVTIEGPSGTHAKFSSGSTMNGNVDRFKFDVKDNRLRIDGRTHGNTKARDWIRFEESGAVFVNGAGRKPVGAP